MGSLVGFRFRPTNEEIIDLLKMKRRDPDFSVHTIKEIAFYKHEPWELPWYSEIQSEEKVWYFFCEPIYKYANSKRAHRQTKNGCWKSTGKGSDLKRKDTGEVIGRKKHVPFRPHGTAYKKAKTEWVMHEISVEDDPLYKKDYVVCRLERRCDNKHATSICNESETSEDLTPCSSIDVAEDAVQESLLPQNEQQMVSYRNHVAENVFQPSSNDSLISYPRNHVAENTTMGFEVLATDHLISYSGNHVAENTSPEFIPQSNQHLVSNYGNHVAENVRMVPPVPSDHLISYSRNHVAENDPAEFQLLASQNLVSYPKNHVAENTAAESELIASQNLASYSRIHVADIAPPELQQPLIQDLFSYSRNYVAENTTPELGLVPNDYLESPKLPNHHLASYATTHVGDTFEVDPQLFAEFNASCGENGMNNAYVSPLPSPINPDLESLYSNGSNYVWAISNSPFYTERVDDLINSQRGFYNEYSHEGPGQSFTPESAFNSSKPDARVYVEGSSDIDTETFIQW